MSQNCDCNSVDMVTLPVGGLSLNVEASALGGVSEERIREILREEIAAQPYGNVPDPRIGEDILWPGRHEGKQIYARMMNFGNLPNASIKSVPHNIADVEWINICEDYSRVIRHDGAVYPPSLRAGSVGWYWGADTEKISFAGIGNATNYTSVVCILYTKTTDPVIG